MKTFYYLSVLLFILSGCHSNTDVITDEAKSSSEEIITYDSLLANSLGADDYGMRQYVMAFLKAGPHRSPDSATSAQLQRAHLDNIIRMADEGTLVVAGPFLDRGEIRGIYIFNVTTVEEAEKLTATDPAIKAGTLVMELHPWYGSAALMQVSEISKRISKVKI